MKYLHNQVSEFVTNLMHPANYQFDYLSGVFLQNTKAFDQTQVVQVIIDRLERDCDFIYRNPTYEILWYSLIDLSLLVLGRLTAGIDAGENRVDDMRLFQQMSRTQYVKFVELVDKIREVKSQKLLVSGYVPSPYHLGRGA